MRRSGLHRGRLGITGFDSPPPHNIFILGKNSMATHRRIKRPKNRLPATHMDIVVTLRVELPQAQQEEYMNDTRGMSEFAKEQVAELVKLSSSNLTDYEITSRALVRCDHLG
jgi:hypothetical protein